MALIESDKRLIRAVAGPGSGKTTGLKRRIERLINNDGIDPSRIYVGNTRAIAGDLRSKLDKEIKVSTLRSLAYTSYQKTIRQPWTQPNKDAGSK